MFFQKTRHVHRVELGKYPHALTLEQIDALVSQAAGTHPDGVDPVIGQGVAVFQQLGRNAAVDPSDLDMRARRLGMAAGGCCPTTSQNDRRTKGALEHRRLSPLG
jgi:hypothetical protein